MCWKLTAIFNLFKIRMRVDIFGNEKCKVTFGLKYMFLKFVMLLLHLGEYPNAALISGFSISLRIWKTDTHLKSALKST